MRGFERVLATKLIGAGMMRGVEDSDRDFMIQALQLAVTAAELGETPVGAVIVADGMVLGTGYNLVETWKDPTAHAEIIALREAARTAHDWRLPNATVYVTLEPCIMCVAALLHARVRRLVYGARDHRWGGAGSLFDLAHDPRINHEIEVVPGLMEQEAAKLLQHFFRRVRDDAG
jgi:tRNA(adenine34) deaminase